jgi:Protein of unknown function (DUF3048) N-terminal domain/Protein of unknown function (DUF3048) C-terminal domain
MQAEPRIQASRRGWWLAWILVVVALAGAMLVACAPNRVETPSPTAPPSPVAVARTLSPAPTEVPAPTPTEPPVPSDTPAPNPTAEPPTVVPSITPTPLGPMAAIGVMIDNDPHARPQTGFIAAAVVYEAPAEFDLTRFLAIYFADAPTNVGSMRSTRPYFALVMGEYGGGLVHCLDVPGVADILTSANVFNFDVCRGFGAEASVRITSRVAPFNLYVNARQLAAELRQRPGRPAAALLPRAELTASDPSASGVSLAYPDGHTVVWTWNGQRFERQQDGAPHREASGEVVTTDVVVVQRADTRPTRYFGEAGYHLITLTGSGDAVLVASGKSQAVRWQRASADAPTTFVDTSGGNIPLPPGRVFWEVVPIESKVQLLS